MKKSFFQVVEYGEIQYLSIKSVTKKFVVFVLFVFLLLFSSKTFSQTIPSTGSSTVTCGNCTPTGWSTFSGTPDISNNTAVGGASTLGADATWASGPLPLPPTGATTWVTLRNVGSGGTEESITTQIGGLVPNKFYEVTVYAMTAITNQDGGPGNDTYYAGTYIDDFDYQIDTNPRQTITNVSKEKWGIAKNFFIGTPDANGEVSLTFYPGTDSGYTTGGNAQLLEAVNIAIELNAVNEVDTDKDGIPDTIDIDDDNDGILDTVETTINGIYYDPLGDEDGDSLPNYLDTRDDGNAGDGSNTIYTDSNNDGIADIFDFDNDGIPNHLDLDADNDGIPDIIEGQPTATYIAPTGIVGTNGLDSAFENEDSLTATSFTVVNTDGTPNTPDFLDLDSDNDGVSDAIEANTNLSGNVGTNGLDNIYDNGDNYTDPNGTYDDTQTNNFPDTTIGGDVDWRDSTTVAEKDTDGDGIPDSIDIDDDNDGILDTVENSSNCQQITYNFTDQASAESNWNFTAPGGNNLQAPNTSNRWSWDNNDTTSVGVGPNTGQGDAGYVYTEMSSGLNGTEFIIELDTNFDASFNSIIFSYYFGYRGDGNNGTIQLQSNENGAGWVNRGNAETLDQQGLNQNDPFAWIQKTVDLSGLLSGSATRFRLVITQGSTGTTWHKDVGLDTVTVSLCSLDSDNDGIPNSLDLDSDNDGIPDNIEAQATTGYIPPSGLDSDNDGLDDAYDTTPNGNSDGTGSLGLIPVNTDGTDSPDYLDTDADNDGTPDRIEANLSLSGIYGSNGLDQNYESADNYADVNGTFDTTPFNDFPDNPAGGEIDWRDATTSFIDTDNDGIPDNVDIDDDNDGILDCVENGLSTATFSDLFNLAGSANQLSSTEIQLTPDLNDQAGSAFSYDKFDFNDSFQISFQVNLGSKDNNGADGIALVFHNDPSGSSAIGQTGLGMGARGIVNGIVLEIDTFDNGAGAGVGDDTTTLDHGMIWDSDNLNSNTDRLTNQIVLGTAGNIEDGAYHDVIVSWNSNTQTLTYTFDATVAGQYTGDLINNHFGGSNLVHFGFTSSTGGFANNQRVRFNNGFCDLKIVIDSDNDGIPNSLDLDSDNDGIPDNIEAQSTTGYIAPTGNVGANGLDSAYENNDTASATGLGGAGGAGLINTDGTDNPDYLDLDSDNDGLLDNTEAGLTLSGVYGINGLDNNYDNGDNYADVNGIFDDTQTDNFPDADNDVNTTGDVDYRDNTFDLDTDGDGIPDAIDLDDDNDGILDIIEECAGFVAQNSTGEWKGKTNSTLSVNMPNTTNQTIVQNFNDGQINYWINQRGGEQRKRGNGNIAFTFNFSPAVPASEIAFYFEDLDGNISGGSPNGVINFIVNGGSNNNTFFPVSGTGITNFNTLTGVYSSPGAINDQSLILKGSTNELISSIEITTSQIGIQDAIGYSLFASVVCDTDGDGIPNSLDLDSDNDGIPDVIEAGGTDANRDGKADGTVGVSGNTLGVPSSAGTGSTPINSDADALPDYLDIDADNDGIPDNIEGQTSSGYLAPSGVGLGIADANNNGVDDNYEVGAVIGVLPPNTDGTDLPDYRDTDSDNDGINDILENGDTNNTLSGTDTDGDGLDDNFDDNDDSSISGSTVNDGVGAGNTVIDTATLDTALGDEDANFPGTGDVDYRDFKDTDNDGVADAFDIDDDNDGILDINEVSGNNNPNGDEDGDGIPNFKDTIDNGNAGDGSTTNYTDSNADGIPDVYDTDGDGIPNHLDLDADNDGIPDNIEAQSTRDYIAPSGNDADNDGLDDAYDATPNGNADGTGSLGITPVDTDTDTTPDFLDLDADGDGIFDVIESGENLPNDGAGQSTGTFGTNGLNDLAETGGVDLGYTDVNGKYDNTQTDNFTDTDGDVLTFGDVDYRDTTTDGVAIITQVYQFNTERWIEVTNIHPTRTIAANNVKVQLYKNKTGDQTGVTPDVTYTVTTALAPGQSVLFTNSANTITNVSGAATVVTNNTLTDIADANDIITLSSKNDTNSYQSRYDVIAAFANKTSFVRIDETLVPNATYTPSEWVVFVDDALDPYRLLGAGGAERHPHDPLVSEIINSNTEANTLLGLHRIDITTRSGNVWSNGYPDRSRFVVIDEDYNHTTARLSARKLTVNTNRKLGITNNLLVVTNDIVLNGEIRLVNPAMDGAAQLIQTHQGASLVTGTTGKLLVDQNSTVPSLYRYNYVGSPVKATVGSTTYTVADVLKDGTNPTSFDGVINNTASGIAKDINWVSGYNGNFNSSPNSPISLADYWIYTYSANGGARAGWAQKFNSGTIPNTDGFIFKGPGRPQNYTFMGIPKDGVITTTVGRDESYLVANPYASSISVKKFIEDNNSSISGTLYFWEHAGEKASNEETSEGHNFRGYIGGYATRTITMGVTAKNAAGGAIDTNLQAEAATNVGGVIENILDTATQNTIDVMKWNGSNQTLTFKKIPGGVDTLRVRYKTSVDKLVRLKVNSNTINDYTLTATTGGFFGIAEIPFCVEIGSDVTLESLDAIELQLDYLKLKDDGELACAPNVGGEGITYTEPKSYIPVGQGFFVQGDDTDGGTITFNNSQREYVLEGSDAVFLKSNSKSNPNSIKNLPVIKLGMDFNNADDGKLYHRQIGVSFSQYTSFDYDKGYDAEIYDIGNTDFYWKFPNNDKKYVIAGVPEISNNLEVPLDIVMGASGYVTLKVDEMKNVDGLVYILDKVTGISYDVINDKASLTLEQGDYKDRFFLTFKPTNTTLSVEEENIANSYTNIHVDNQNKMLVISKEQDISIHQVEVYSILGRKIYNWQVKEQKQTLQLNLNKNLPTSIYFVKLKTDKGEISKKIILE